MPTERQMASEQGGFVSPFDVARSTDHDQLQEAVDVIDATGPGWVTVKRTAGRAPQPHDRLHGDASAVVYPPNDPGVTVRIMKDER
jgi:hypothetical protein